MPENIPPAEHISNVEKRIKNTPPFLELDGSDAKGLIGTDGEWGLVLWIKVTKPDCPQSTIETGQIY